MCQINCIIYANVLLYVYKHVYYKGKGMDVVYSERTKLLTCSAS